MVCATGFLYISGEKRLAFESEGCRFESYRARFTTGADVTRLDASRALFSGPRAHHHRRNIRACHRVLNRLGPPRTVPRVRQMFGKALAYRSPVRAGGPGGLRSGWGPERVREALDGRSCIMQPGMG